MYQIKAETGAASAAKGTLPSCSEWTNRRASEQASRAARARQVSGRRRFVDPTTCERDYSEAEMEFMMAMNEYKKASGRMFPTWSEVLEVLRTLGYEKVPGLTSIDQPAAIRREATLV
ncbi:hypothetical protein [Aquisphaera insulae]|uniref:hypothetical protein n=1 Tax=Aquisphaera insulae TaxID=2712864 RepID=UPI00196B3B01|nr:hypothetical protein [Aquisphaera insulae]